MDEAGEKRFEVGDVCQQSNRQRQVHPVSCWTPV